MSALGGFFADEVVLDLCAGSGAVGIELLSRGCKRAVFVEPDAAALACLRDNLRRAGLLDRAEILPVDARRGLRELGGRGVAFDIVFVDPPYASGLHDALLAGLFKHELVADRGEIVIERAAADTENPAIAAPWEVFWERRYGAARMQRIARSQAPEATP